MTVMETGTITKLALGIGEITQTFNDDLDIYLTSPSGTRREVSTDNGVSGDGYLSALFSDDATSSISTLDNTTTIVRGKYKPEQSFWTTSGTDFLSQTAAGTWTLKVIDDAGSDIGSINSWTLGICVQ